MTSLLSPTRDLLSPTSDLAARLGTRLSPALTAAGPQRLGTIRSIAGLSV